PARVGVAVLVEANPSSRRARVDLHVDAGEGSARLLVGDLDLPVALDDRHEEGVRVVSLSLSQPGGDDLDDDVRAVELLREVEGDRALASGELDPVGAVRLDEGELARLLLDERLPREEEL